MTSTRKKLRSLTLVMLMVVSVFGGTIAFAGSAAAQTGNETGLDPSSVGPGDDLTDFYHGQTVSLSGNRELAEVNVDLAGSNINNVGTGDVQIYVDNNIVADEGDFASFSTSNGEVNVVLEDTAIATVSDGDVVQVQIDDAEAPVQTGDYDITTGLFQDDGSRFEQYTDTLTVETGDDADDNDPPYEGPDSGTVDNDIDYDSYWETGSTQFQGSTLLFEAEDGASAGDDYELWAVDDDDNLDSFVRDISLEDATLAGDDEGPSEGPVALVTTGDLQGDYVILDASSNPALTDGADHPGLESGDGSVEDAVVNIQPQTLDVNWESDSVNEGGTETLEVDSNRRSYLLTVEASGLDESETRDLFDEAGVGVSGTDEGDDAAPGYDGVQIQIDNTFDEIDDVDFDDVDTGDYDFTFTAADTGVDDSDTLTVGTAEDADANFAESTVVQQRGDVAEYTINVENSDTVALVVGNEEVNYRTTVSLEDDDDDGQVNVSMNTFYAGKVDADDEEDTALSNNPVWSVGDDTNVLAIERSEPSGSLSDPLEAAQYPLSAQIAGEEKDVGSLVLRERGTIGSQQWTAPGDLDADDALDEVTQTQQVAQGDWAVAQFEASGLYGYFDSDTEFNQSGYAEGSANSVDYTTSGLRITIEPEAGINREADQLSPSDEEVELEFDAENDTFFVLVDTEQLDTEEYVVEYSLSEDENPYVDDEDEELDTSFTVRERTATFDTDQGLVTVEASENQTITGTTNIAPNTELRITANSQEIGNEFLLEEEAVVQNDGSFNASFDFSSYDSNTSFTLTIPNAGFDDDAETPGRLGQAETASATFNNQSFTGQASSVNVANVTTSDGGFVTIHDSTLVSDGAVFDSVRGTSDYLEPGTETNVTVELDSPINPSGSGTYYAMPHLDTDGDQTYDFVTSEGADDGPYTDDEGNAIVDPATITVERLATVTFNDQQQMGDTVLVESARLPDGGFVTIHDSTVADDPFGSVRGTSGYLEPGTSADINITLDEPAEESGQFFAMPHRDTDGDESYDFVSSNGDDDSPYLNADGQIVLDAAQIQVGGMDTATPTPTEPPEEPTPTPTDEPTPTDTDEPETTTTTGGQPGFGLAVSLIALVGAALIALRRRD